MRAVWRPGKGKAWRGGAFERCVVVMRRVDNSRSDYPPVASVDKAAPLSTLLALDIKFL